MSTLLWSLFFLAGAGFFAFQVWGRFKVLLKIRKDDGRNYSLSTWALRLKTTLVYAFAQRKFFRDEQPAGGMHVVIFWGFVTLSLQVITMFVRGWFPEFYLPFLESGLLANIYGVAKDLLQVGVILAIGVALYRWKILKPRRLYGILPAEEKLSKNSHWEAYLILFFITTIMLSGFLYDAGREVLAEGSSESSMAFITAYLANLFKGDKEAALMASEVGWWIHNLVILTFLNLLPRSKHFHIVTSIPNVFLGKIEPRGKLAKKDYSGETPLFGRSLPMHFTWKQAMDMYSCTECGRCSSVCPAAATGKTLAPRQFLINLRDELYKNQDKIHASANGEGFDLVIGDGKAIIDDVVWSCVTCRACEEACPVNIEYVDKMVDIRQHLVQEASRFPSELNRAFQGMERNSNPWGMAASERMAWAEGLDVPLISQNQKVDYLYYVGCGGAFDTNHRKATQSFIKILKQAGVSFAVMGTDETCNGDSARRLGNEYLYQTMAEALAAKINSYNVKNILVNCPHCFNTMKNEYPDFGGHWNIESAATFVNQLVKSGKLKLKNDFEKKVVYHDSCYYGRYNDQYEDPRELLGKSSKKIPLEMETSKQNSTCCGAGGGRMWLEEKADQRVNVMRTEQALATNPEVVATSCPFCRIMMSSGINEKGAADKVAVMDVMEVVANNLVT